MAREDISKWIQQQDEELLYTPTEVYDTFTYQPRPLAPSQDAQEIAAAMLEALASAPLPGHATRWPDTSALAGTPAPLPPPPSAAAPNAAPRWSVQRWGSVDIPAGDTRAYDYSPRPGEEA